MRWPNGNRLIRSPGSQLTGLPAAFGSVAFSPTRDGERFAPYRGGQGGPTNSVPEGFAPHAWTPPTVAGSMTARSFAGMTAAANMLNGVPMQATWAAGMTMDGPSMSLVVSMTATWTAGMAASSNLRLTVGMSAEWTAGISATANLAMIVPLGSATWTAGISAIANLKGRLSMSAEFGGADPLSPEGLANAVWEALAANHNVAGTMGAKLNAAGSASDPWSTPEGQSVVNNTGLIPALL